MPDMLLNCMQCQYYKLCQFQFQERERIALQNKDNYVHYLSDKQKENRIEL